MEAYLAQLAASGNLEAVAATASAPSNHVAGSTSAIPPRVKRENVDFIPSRSSRPSKPTGKSRSRTPTPSASSTSTVKGSGRSSASTVVAYNKKQKGRSRAEKAERYDEEDELDGADGDGSGEEDVEDEDEESKEEDSESEEEMTILHNKKERSRSRSATPTASKIKSTSTATANKAKLIETKTKSVRLIRPEGRVAFDLGSSNESSSGDDVGVDGGAGGKGDSDSDEEEEEEEPEDDKRDRKDGVVVGVHDEDDGVAGPSSSSTAKVNACYLSQLHVDDMHAHLRNMDANPSKTALSSASSAAIDDAAKETQDGPNPSQYFPPAGESQLEIATRTFKTRSDAVVFRTLKAAQKEAQRRMLEGLNAAVDAASQPFHRKSPFWAGVMSKVEELGKEAMGQGVDRCSSSGLESAYRLACLDQRSKAESASPLLRFYAIKNDNDDSLEVIRRSHLTYGTSLFNHLGDGLLSDLPTADPATLKKRREDSTAAYKLSHEQNGMGVQADEDDLKRMRLKARLAKLELEASERGGAECMDSEVGDDPTILTVTDAALADGVRALDALKRRLSRMQEATASREMLWEVVAGVTTPSDEYGFSDNPGFGTELLAKHFAHLLHAASSLRAFDDGFLSAEAKSEHDAFLDKYVVEVNTLLVLLAMDKDILLLSGIIVGRMNRAIDCVRAKGWWGGRYAEVWEVVLDITGLAIATATWGTRSSKTGTGEYDKAVTTIHPTLRDFGACTCPVCLESLPVETAETLKGNKRTRQTSMGHYAVRRGKDRITDSRADSRLLLISMKALAPCLSTLLFQHERRLHFGLVYAALPSVVLMHWSCHGSRRGKGWDLARWFSGVPIVAGSSVDGVIKRALSTMETVEEEGEGDEFGA